MILHYFIILLPAILVTLIGYHTSRNNSRWDTVNTKEMLISLAGNFISGLVMIAILSGYINSQVTDTYTLNGKVTGKYREKVSCVHSYQVCTTSGKVTTCTTHYEHWEDYSWMVKTSLGEIEIEREDRQGAREPQRYTKVILGEPASMSYNYNNYLLADSKSLFLQNAQGSSNLRQPSIYDYYRVDHVTGKVDIELENLLDVHLQGKRYNVKLVFLKDRPVEYFYVVMKTWLGGKINDVIVVVSEDTNGNVLWVKANTYAKGLNNQFTIKSIENKVVVGSPYTINNLKNQLQIIDEGYEIPSESEFEEKLSMVEIPTWLLVLMIIVNLIISIGIHIKMKQEDL